MQEQYDSKDTQKLISVFLIVLSAHVFCISSCSHDLLLHSLWLQSYEFRQSVRKDRLAMFCFISSIVLCP
jgi:hypothetical protein